jgi:hypothetical protein
MNVIHIRVSSGDGRQEYVLLRWDDVGFGTHRYQRQGSTDINFQP